MHFTTHPSPLTPTPSPPLPFPPLTPTPSPPLPSHLGSRVVQVHLHVLSGDELDVKVPQTVDFKLKGKRWLKVTIDLVLLILRHTAGPGERHAAGPGERHSRRTHTPPSHSRQRNTQYTRTAQHTIQLKVNQSAPQPLLRKQPSMCITHEQYTYYCTTSITSVAVINGSVQHTSTDKVTH